MRKRTWMSLLLALIIFVNLVGASILGLVGSDATPWEHRYRTQCAQPKITEDIDNNDHGNAYKVRAIILTGDFSACIGQQMLVSVSKNGNKSSYAVYNCDSAIETVTLTFDSGQGAGDFKQKFPLIQHSRLVPQDPASPAPNDVNLSDIQVSFASSWS